jgi:hypothetical protein
MQRTLYSGLALALLASLAAMASDTLALSQAWPLLLAAAVGFVPGWSWTGRVLGYVVGAAGMWLAYGLRVEFMPDVAVSRGVFVAVPVLVAMAAALATSGRAPLWAGLAGAGAFAGIYDAAFRANPAGFLAESASAATGLVLASAVGFLAALLAQLAQSADAGPGEPAPQTAPDQPLSDQEV